MLTPTDVHYDEMLSNLVVAHTQDKSNFISEKIFPRVSVRKQSDKYYIWDRNNFNRTDNVKKLAPGTATETIGLTLSSDAYFAEVYGLGFQIDEQTLANADDQLNIRETGAYALAEQMLIHRENLWISTYFAPGVWNNQWTGVAATPAANQFVKWSDYVNSTPIVDVLNMKRAAFLRSGGFRPNVMVMTRDVRDKLVNHPDLLSRLNGGATVTNTALITDAKIAEIFEVEELLVIDGIQNTAKEGLAENLTWMATGRVALFHRPSKAGIMVPSAGYTFTWDSLAQSSGYGIGVRSFKNDYLKMHHIDEKIEVVMSYGHKVIGKDLGVFLQDVI